MFRVFGHLYCNHLSSVTTLGLHTFMNTCFKHYLYFIEEYELIHSQELKPLSGYIQISLGRPFGKIYRNNHDNQQQNLSSSSNKDPDITAFSSIDNESSHFLNNSNNTNNSQNNNNANRPSKFMDFPTITTTMTTLSTLPKNISIDVATEYKNEIFDDKLSRGRSHSSSVSIQTGLNSLTPTPTRYDNDGEEQSKINATVQNRSVYEYIFHRNGQYDHMQNDDMNGNENANNTMNSTLSHVALPESTATATLKRYYLDDSDIKDDYKEGGFADFEPSRNEEEEKMMEMEDRDFTGYTKYHTPSQQVQNEIVSVSNCSSGYRNCKIIRKSSKNTEADKVDFLMNKTLQRIPLLSIGDLNHAQDINQARNGNMNLAPIDIPPPPAMPNHAHIDAKTNYLSVPKENDNVDNNNNNFAYSPFTESAMDNKIKIDPNHVFMEDIPPAPIHIPLPAEPVVVEKKTRLDSPSPSFRDVVFYRHQVRVK